jgi:hypothetical protein
MYHTRETVIRPDWRTVIKSMAAILLLGACWLLVMGEDASWTTLEAIDSPEENSSE